MAKESIFVVVVMTPAPGKIDELENFAEEGAKHHESLPECLSWHASRSIDLAAFEKGWTDTAVEGELVITQEWSSLNALLEHGKSEWAAKTRDEIAPLMAGAPIMKIAKGFGGFQK